MLRKKLLTIACVAGILACGACFLPPIDRTPPSPPSPPLRDELRGIRTIDLFVDDDSGSQLIDAVQAAGRIAGNMNARTYQTSIRCDLRPKPKPGDAILRIVLLKESATRESGHVSPHWLILMTVNATLAGPDGKILWQQQNKTYFDLKPIKARDPAEVWKDPKTADWISTGFSDQLLGGMFYGI